MRVLALAALVAACSPSVYRPAYDVAPVSLLAGHAALAGPGASAQRKNPLVWQDIAVRHRRASRWNPLVLFSGLAQAAPAVTPATAPATAVDDAAKIVVELWLTVQTDDVARAAADAEAWVRAAGGRVVSSSIVTHRGGNASAALELRVAPGKASELASFVGGRGRVASQRMLASDVGKQVVDHELELHNLRIEMTRLEELAARNGSVEELLAIEKELTRVRGEIERVEGELQFLADRVELATVSITLSSAAEDDSDDGEPVPRAVLHPGAHVATLSVLDSSAGTRIGGGVTIALRRSFSLDLDVFPRAATDSRAVIATAGTAMYGSSLGYGRRRFLNPYLGARAGYGYLHGRGAFVLAGELGLELVRQRGLVVDLAARAVALFADAGSEAALQTQLGITVPF